MKLDLDIPTTALLAELLVLERERIAEVVASGALDTRLTEAAKERGAVVEATLTTLLELLFEIDPSLDPRRPLSAGPESPKGVG